MVKQIFFYKIISLLLFKIIDKTTKMLNLLSEMINLPSETININTKDIFFCFVLFWALKTMQNDKFIVKCCFGDKKQQK